MKKKKTKTKKTNKEKVKKTKKIKVAKEKSVKIKKVGNMSSSLDMFFKAQKIAVIGASHEIGKVGNVIFRNLYQRKTVYPVNPNASEIFHIKCYKSVLEIEDSIDLAIIAIKANLVPSAVEECGKKKIKNVIIISSGFKEVGNNILDKKLHDVLEKYGIRCIGPNCLGILDSYSELDSIFLSKQKLKRPRQGSISFISQSGALGGMILDVASQKRYGLAKFISYGNAMNLNECDFLEYLKDDPETKVICLYVEQIKDGKRFLDVAKKVSSKKPLIIFKGGTTGEGNKAALSHTGSLAGNAKIYEGIFKQVNAIQVENLEDLFFVADLFEKFENFKNLGSRIQIITNGGGYGIICADQIAKNDLKLAEFSSKSKEKLKKEFPRLNLNNPLDLMGDVTNDMYKKALETCLDDINIDLILLVILYQTPLINEDIVDIVSEINNKGKKPIVLVVPKTASEVSISELLEDKGLVCFEFPENAVRALKKFLGK